MTLEFDRAREGMSRIRSPFGWAAASVVVVVAILAVASFGLVRVAGSPGPATERAVLRTADARPGGIGPAYKVLEQTFPGANSVYLLASLNSTALVVNQYLNGSYETLLYRAPANTTRVVQKVVPGYSTVALGSVTAAGGAFFLSWFNTTTSKTFWQKVTVGGKVTRLPTPGGNTVVWSFAYGNLSSLYVTTGFSLLELNPFTLSTVASFTSALPTGVSVGVVLPAPGRLYLAGDRVTTKGGYDPYLGVYSFSTGTVTTISKATKAGPSVAASFLTLDASGSYVYAGGVVDALTSSGYTPVQGLLYRYDTGTSAFKNESSGLPVPDWGVYAISAWGKAVAVSLSGFSYSSTTGLSSLGGGIYTLVQAGTVLRNLTGSLPAGYFADIYGVTSSSSPWLFSGGTNPGTGLAQVVAIKA